MSPHIEKLSLDGNAIATKMDKLKYRSIVIEELGTGVKVIDNEEVN